MDVPAQFILEAIQAKKVPKPSKHILIVTHHYPPHITGVGMAARNQAKRLAALGHTVTVVTSKTSTNEDSGIIRRRDCHTGEGPELSRESGYTVPTVFSCIAAGYCCGKQKKPISTNGKNPLPWNIRL